MAATGTPTPNLGLRRAQGTDPASVDDINYNSELLDTKLGAVGATSVQGQIDALSASTAQTFGNVQDGLAIVSNGNTHVAIPAGYWVYVKGHGTLSEGLYKNTSGATIAANATLSTSNLTADPDGGLNSVYAALNSKFAASTMTVHTNKTATLAKSGRVVNAFIPGISSVSMTSWQSIEVGTIPAGFEAISNSVYTVLPIQLGTTYIPVFYRVDGNKIYLENQSGNTVTTGTIMAMMLTWIAES